MSQPLTPIKAIRAKCRECGGNSTKTIRLCRVTDCPLYPYRMGKRPNDDASLKKPDPELKTRRLKGVIKDALQRYEQGKDEYGPLELSTDKRNFIEEAEQELLDCINYCSFQVLRMRKQRQGKLL